MKESAKMPTGTVANPKIVSQQEWEAAWQGLLVKEKAFTQSRDALAAERAGAHFAVLFDVFEFRPRLHGLRLAHHEHLPDHPWHL